MLGDLSGVSKLYLVTGRTDMRLSIDGLMAIIRDTYQMDPYANALYLFCGRKSDRLKHCIMVRLVLYCCICGWTPVSSSGRAMHLKSVLFPARNIAGSWKGFPLTSQRRCAPRKRGISDYFCEKQRI